MLTKITLIVFLIGLCFFGASQLDDPKETAEDNGMKQGIFIVIGLFFELVAFFMFLINVLFF